ncbi:MAG: leucine-rich repeat domain-containing protein [Acidobacteriota bacterium]
MVPSNLQKAHRRIEEARKTRAKTLDLGDLTLEELPPSLEGLRYLETLSLGMARVTDTGEFEFDPSRTASSFKDLRPLSGLTALQSLDLNGCGVSDLAPFSNLTALQVLNLSGCMGVSDLAPISNLTALQDLNLRWCMGVSDLAPISNLTALQDLNLSWCKGVSDLAPISNLTALQNLDLSGCKGISDLAPTSGLPALQSLDLGGCGVSDLAPFSNLTALQVLNLSRCEGVSDLAPISSLTALQRLNLSWCQGVSDLAPISNLTALQDLNLTVCQGVSDLAPISNLIALQNLTLTWCHGVSDLAPISNLKALQDLDLSGCEGVSDLAPISNLTALQYLNLRRCTAITDLSVVSDLDSLENVGLLGCEAALSVPLLRAIADLPLMKELYADGARGVPREVLSQYLLDNCLPRLRAHFADLDLAAERENEVKVILLGNGGVGKTQLCRRFRGLPFDPSIPSTHGVEIWREELRLQAGGENQTLQVNWWDFGGQDIYHGTHALFLRSRAVFLLLWTPGSEEREEREEHGVLYRNQPLAYWLDYIRSLAGADSPVIVVQSQCESFGDRESAPPRPEGFGFFECCAYGAAGEELGRDTLESQLRDAIRYLAEGSGPLQIGHGRAEVRRRLYRWRDEDQERRPEERQHRTVTLDRFRELCDEIGGITSWEHALEYFHQTGVVFYRKNLFARAVILDQTWALDAVYAVFDRQRAVPLLLDSGRYSREDLARTVWQEHSVEEQELFLGLMESCDVCFRCGTTPGGEPRYLAPDLLPGFAAVERRLQFWQKDDPGTPLLRLKYRFFHPALVRSLMSQVGEEVGDLAEYWKYGLWFRDGRRDSQLLVRFEDTASEAAPGAGDLVIETQGGDAIGLLREIRERVLRRRVGEEPDERLTLEGLTVARSALTGEIGGKVLDVRGEAVPAAPFAAFFAATEKERNAVPDVPRIEQHLPALRPERKVPEVFISYAWGDETEASRTREKVVDELCTALASDGFRPVRDRDVIVPGELISHFVDHLTRAELVVAVLSDRYVRSPYCMYEVYKLWQRSQGEAEQMLRYFVPIVLPEVSIGSLEERAPYIRFWRDKATALEPVIAELGLSVGDRSWGETRRTKEFAHHIDDILAFCQDVLMPRKLDVHFDDGFAAVREALRRRIAGSEADVDQQQESSQIGV